MIKDDLTYAVIGKAMEVHRELGPGVDEVFYHQLLSLRLRQAGIEHLSRPRAQLVHRGLVADRFEPDVAFPSRLIGELKCLRGTFDGEHYAQIICYLKFWNIGVGLLFDFGKESLFHRRVVYTPVPLPALHPADVMKDLPSGLTDEPLVKVLCESIVRIGVAYGLGYRDTTYRGLLAADLAAEGIQCCSTPVVAVRCDDQWLGEAQCDCLGVSGCCAVRVLALRDKITASDRAILQTHLKLLDLTWGLIVNFGKHHLEHRWVTRQREPPRVQGGQR